jgi:poly-beta-1,6-N-acetyl-D-glucosamine N-deacetylase
MDIRLSPLFASISSLAAPLWLAFAIIWTSTFIGFIGAARTADGAVAIMYHRFGESSYPSTNITIAQFEAHIEILKRGPYKVIPATELAAALKAGRTLPDNVVVITVDDAYLSVYTEAWPRLKKANFPFTVFVSTGSVGQRGGRYMNWDQIRELRDSGVYIGNHSNAHSHMAHAGVAENIAEINKAKQRLAKELGASSGLNGGPRIFAYPFGETSSAVRNTVIAAGFNIAFGQHSGAISQRSDRYNLPRFSLNEQYGDKTRFTRIIGALPLPVHDITPANPLIGKGFGANPPAFGFTLDASLTNTGALSCFHSPFGPVPITKLGTHRVEIRFPKAFKPGRARINCTMPGPNRRIRWFGSQFLVIGD